MYGYIMVLYIRKPWGKELERGLNKKLFAWEMAQQVSLRRVKIRKKQSTINSSF